MRVGRVVVVDDKPIRPEELVAAITRAPRRAAGNGSA